MLTVLVQVEVFVYTMLFASELKNEFCELLQHKEYQQIVYDMGMYVSTFWLKHATKQLKKLLIECFENEQQHQVMMTDIDDCITLLQKIKLCVRLGAKESHNISNTNTFHLFISSFFKYHIYSFDRELQLSSQGQSWMKLQPLIFDILQEMVSIQEYGSSISTLDIPILNMLQAQVQSSTMNLYYSTEYVEHVSCIIVDMYGCLIRNGIHQSIFWFTPKQQRYYQQLRKKDMMKRILDERDDLMPEAKRCKLDYLKDCATIIAEYRLL